MGPRVCRPTSPPRSDSRESSRAPIGCEQTGPCQTAGHHHSPPNSCRRFRLSASQPAKAPKPVGGGAKCTRQQQPTSPTETLPPHTRCQQGARTSILAAIPPVDGCRPRPSHQILRVPSAPSIGWSFPSLLQCNCSVVGEGLAIRPRGHSVIPAPRSIGLRYRGRPCYTIKTRRPHGHIAQNPASNRRLSWSNVLLARTDRHRPTVSWRW